MLSDCTIDTNTNQNDGEFSKLYGSTDNEQHTQKDLNNLDQITNQSSALGIYNEVNQKMMDLFAAFQKAMAPWCDTLELEKILRCLIFNTDERVLTSVDVSNGFHAILIDWPKLQEEWFNTRCGGDEFFEDLNTVLADENQYPFAIEIFYFILKSGFKGCYLNKPDILSSLLISCADAICAKQKSDLMLGGELE